MLASDQSSASLALGGTRISGHALRAQNSAAVQAIANVVKSSLGPMGLDKMLVDSIGELTVSNDGATILKLLEVEHPAARILVDLAQQQDEEVGDGTTSVVILAADLLARATDLVISKGLHPTIIISGYRLACKEACRYIAECLAQKVDLSASSMTTRDILVAVARTSLASKVLGAYGDFFPTMAVDAIQAVKTGGAPAKYPVKAVNVLKAHGQSAADSVLISNGYAVNVTPASPVMPRRIKGAKIACLDIDLQKTRLPSGIVVEITSPDKLEAVRRRELEITLERVSKILASGANVVLTARGIDDPCLKPFIERNCMAVRRVRREDLKRIAKCTGATFITSLASINEPVLSAGTASSASNNLILAEETFDVASLGHAEEVFVERFGDDECLIIRGPKASSSASIILRGPSDTMLEEEERALHDAMCVVKRCLEGGLVVPGGGACEAACSVQLDALATTIASKEQVAIGEFAQALLALPKALIGNSQAGDSAPELLSKLLAAHYAYITGGGGKDLLPPGLNMTGLDLRTLKVRNSMTAGIVEPALVKVKALRAATEAAIAILRVDDMMRILPIERMKPDQEDDECE